MNTEEKSQVQGSKGQPLELWDECLLQILKRQFKLLFVHKSEMSNLFETFNYITIFQTMNGYLHGLLRVFLYIDAISYTEV